MISETYKQVKDVSSGSGRLLQVARALLLGLGITLLLFVIFALLLAYTGLPEGAIPFIAIVTAIISASIAGISAAKSASSRGYLSGGLVGILYVLVLYVLSFIPAGGLYANMYILILLGIGILAGAFGGILGINLSTRKKRY